MKRNEKEWRRNEIIRNGVEIEWNKNGTEMGIKWNRNGYEVEQK